MSEVTEPRISFGAETLDRLRQQLSSPQRAADGWPELRREAERLSLIRGFETLLGLDLNRIDEYPYQIEAAQKVLREMRGRCLLADEVGLGKTIEALLIYKEYAIRGLVRNCLILTPPGLVGQWVEELESKFNEYFTVAEDPEQWTASDLVIGSLDRAKLDRHSGPIQERHWDLVIVDEAHDLRNADTKAWQFVNSLRARRLLLLTATPVQNDLRDLYNLITLLKPGQLGTYRQFRARFISGHDPRQPVNLRLMRQLLSECMIRNRRSQVTVKLPTRHAYVYHTQLSGPERELYEAVSGYARDHARAGVRVLTQILLQRQVCSSHRAIAGTLERLVEREPSEPLIEMSRLANSIDSSAKATAVTRIAREADDRVLVFTEYRGTQQAILESLEAEGLPARSFHGGMTQRQRVETLEHFRDEGGVLVSTDTGAEGLNLQFCNVLVNVDLPWNPLRLEQRIGRLHRLGQTREVYVFNLAAPDTIEDDILDLLTHKLRMFELVIGELDTILGLMGSEQAFERALNRIWQEAQNDRAFRAALEELGEQVIVARDRFAGIKEADLMVSQVFDE